MGDNGILLGRRQFLYCRGSFVHLHGWSFILESGIHMIAGGTLDPIRTLISLYRDNEKVGQLCLWHKRVESTLMIQAIASDVLIEISASAQTVTISNKLL